MESEERGDETVLAPSDSNPLVRKLGQFLFLSDADRHLLSGLAGPDSWLPPDVDIIHEGQKPRSVFLIKEGMAMRYRHMPDGGRQIMTFLIPGDLCDVHVFLVTAMDHSIATVTAVRLAYIPRESLMDIFVANPRISATLWWSLQQEEAILRERIVALGRRNARGRVAYFLCEIFWRHAAVGLTQQQAVGLPLTQVEIADTLGLTSVHVNRILQEFKRHRLIAIVHRQLTLLNLEGLKTIAGFNEDYLHLGGAAPEVRRYFEQLNDR